MKAYKVIFSNGQFLEKGTNKRILLANNGEFILTGEEHFFADKDEKLRTPDLMEPDAKLDFVQKKFGKDKVLKLLPSGTILFFRLGNSKRLSGEKTMEYFFKCTLLEDLYMYKIGTRAQSVYDSWRLAPCVCALIDCVFGGIKVPESFQAKSLNQLFSNTVMFFFSLQRSGACNAFDTFFQSSGKDGEMIRNDFIGKHAVFLRNLRLKVVDEKTEKLTKESIARAQLSFLFVKK
jgi:hypothetical protein